MPRYTIDEWRELARDMAHSSGVSKSHLEDLIQFQFADFLTSQMRTKIDVLERPAAIK